VLDHEEPLSPELDDWLKLFGSRGQKLVETFSSGRRRALSPQPAKLAPRELAIGFNDVPEGGMSAFEGKADIGATLRNVRF
jgi:hypothetical protein